MPEDDVSQTFYRAPRQAPRATGLCYALAAFHASVAITWGIIEGGARLLAAGCILAVFGFGLWIAIGTALALLAQIADRGRPPVLSQQQAVQLEERVPAGY